MPAKLLAVNATLGTVVKTTNANPVAWRTTLAVTPQPHSDLLADPDGFFDGTDVKVGDYVTTTNGGKALVITYIVSATANSVVCNLEDEGLINANLDPNQGLDSKIPNGAGLLFEVVNGIPVLYPLPDALPGTFDETFAAQLLSRFQALNPAVPDNVLTDDLLDVANGIPTLNSSAKLDISKLAPLTKADVGLSNVDNTADLNKPVSTATQIALNAKIDLSSRGVANGVAPLGNDGLLPSNIIPGGSIIVTVADYSSLPETGETNKFYVVTSENVIYLWTGSTYIDITAIGGGGGDTYEYIAVGVDSTLSNKQVVSLLADDLVLTLPAEPANGTEIIILNSGGYGFTLTNGPGSETINGAVNDYVAVPALHKSLYLVYINDWKLSDSNQSININTAAEAKSTDHYWLPNTIHEITAETVYTNKQAFIETWSTQLGAVVAEQITIFDDYDNSDNYRQIWFPREGTALEKRVVLSELPMIDLPAVSYYANLVFSLVRTLNVNWRNFETFEDLVTNSTNFFNIINNQTAINIISANSTFLFDFTESLQAKKMTLPVLPMTTNNQPTGYGLVITGTTSNPTNAWKVFDNDPATYWESVSGQVTNQNIDFEFGSFGGSRSLFPHTINITTSDSAKCPKNVKLQHYVGGTWETAGEFVLDNSQTDHEFKITTAGIADDTWRFLFVNNWGGDTILVNELKLTGWNINLMA